MLGTIGSLIVYLLILWMNRSISRPGQTTGHSYDGIEEFDNPLPAWWFWGFVASIAFGFAYLIYYPGLGNFPGISGWTQIGQLEEAQAIAEERYGPIFAQYGDVPVDELSKDQDVLKMGRRLFATNCSVCHGATGQGSYGFPNLADSEWMWGGSSEAIETSILDGRNGLMVPWGPVLGDDGVAEAAQYVMSLSGREVDEAMAARGETHFQMYCAACHTAEGTGNVLFGAPDLTNEIWLYGNSQARIEHTIRNGRNSMMPSFRERLGEDKVHIVAAYVKSLSQNP
jgi:cytochrome c oxidase cbb3-type subunit 3